MISFNEWYQCYGDSYIESLSYEYQYDMYLDYIGA